MTNYGSLARSRRLELGMTQVQVADKAGCSLDTVNVFENDRRNMTMDIVLSILDAVGLKVEVVEK